jgi:hypothetical protein
VSKLGKRLIQAAREGVAIARGELDPGTYRVHHAPDDDTDLAIVMARKKARKKARKRPRSPVAEK